jgi:hypothetical protein
MDLDLGDPAVVSASVNSLRVSAPGMHPVHSVMSDFVISSMPSSAVTSENASHPPGRSTLAASASTTFLSAATSMTQFEITT